MSSPDNQAMDDLDDLLESALEDFENSAKHRKGSVRKVVSKKATLDDKKKAEGIQEKLKKIQKLPAHEREEMIKLKPASPQRYAEVIFGQAILWMFVYAAMQLAAGHPVEPYVY